MKEVSYHPVILTSMAAICKAFGVGKQRVKEWQKAGAPIVAEGEGEKRRYSAEAMRLQLWRESQSRGGQGTVRQGGGCVIHAGDIANPVKPV